jgi:hypothetical protein
VTATGTEVVTGLRHHRIMHSETISFSAAVRAIGQEARRMGLVVPGFRSPPRLPGANRTIRRSEGQPIIAVRLRGRPLGDVVADVVEGVMVANGVPLGDLGSRRRLLEAVEATCQEAA